MKPKLHLILIGWKKFLNKMKHDPSNVFKTRRERERERDKKIERKSEEIDR